MSAHDHRTVSPAESAAPISVEVVKARAAQWLIRRDVGLDAAGQRELAAWLVADSRHQAVFAELEGTWAVFERAQRKGIAGSIVANLEARQHARRRRRRNVATAIAVVAVLLAAVGIHRYSARMPWKAVAAAAPEQMRMLPDGSIVELRAGAEIAVEYTVAARRVRQLRGEAHFRVEKDSQRPFLVTAGPVEVRAVGTAFTVQLHSRAVEVVVAEGRVAVNHDARGPAVAKMPARPLAYMDASTRLMLDFGEREASALDATSSPLAELNDRPEWRIQRIEFSGMQLGDAVAAMNRENRLQILLENGLHQLRVSGSFRTDHPEGFVRIVAATFGLRAERHGESKIVLRRIPGPAPNP